MNTTSAHLMWNPTETNFTQYKIYISNRTFADEHFIWGIIPEHTVTDLTPGGIHNIVIRRVRGNVERPSTFIRVVTGIQILIDILKINICVTYYNVQDKISVHFFNLKI